MSWKYNLSIAYQTFWGIKKVNEHLLEDFVIPNFLKSLVNKIRFVLAQSVLVDSANSFLLQSQKEIEGSVGDTKKVSFSVLQGLWWPLNWKTSVVNVNMVR